VAARTSDARVNLKAIMKKHWMVLAVFCGAILPVAAQMAVPLQLDVKPITRNKGVGGGYFYNNTQSKRALQITIQNTSPRPVTGVKVRWAIVKMRVRASSDWHERAFGAEETFDLKPREQKIIETAEVGAYREEDNFSGYVYGDKIIGHGVQVLVDGKIVAKMYVPGSSAVEKTMEKIYAVDSEERNGRTRSKP
jgi:hypothetical protein